MNEPIELNYGRCSVPITSSMDRMSKYKVYKAVEEKLSNGLYKAIVIRTKAYFTVHIYPHKMERKLRLQHVNAVDEAISEVLEDEPQNTNAPEINPGRMTQ